MNKTKLKEFLLKEFSNIDPNKIDGEIIYHQPSPTQKKKILSFQFYLSIGLIIALILFALFGEIFLSTTKTYFDWMVILICLFFFINVMFFLIDYVDMSNTLFNKINIFF